jgi:hypothetical protein
MLPGLMPNGSKRRARPFGVISLPPFESAHGIAERFLAHAIGSVRGVYDRHAYLEEKWQAFDALAAEVASIVGGQP